MLEKAANASMTHLVTSALLKDQREKIPSGALEIVTLHPEA